MNQFTILSQLLARKILRAEKHGWTRASLQRAAALRVAIKRLQREGK